MTRHHRHSHTHSHGSESRRLGGTILLNLVITAAEVVGGIASGSLALLSDAGHNLSDVIALILAWFGAKGARMKPTKRATYGFRRLEVVTALINALSLVAIAGYIIREAFLRYAQPQDIDAPVMLGVAVIGLAGNVLSVLILHRDRNRTINNRAAFLHMLYDAVSSVAVIVGGIVIYMTDWYLLDLILSVLIAIMILWSSFDILKEAAGIFMESVPRNIDVDEVTAAILDVPQVCDMHHLHIWSISSDRVALSCHIVLAPDDFRRAPEIIRSMNEMLAERFAIEHATVQPEMEHCPGLPTPAPGERGSGDA